MKPPENWPKRSRNGHLRPAEIKMLRERFERGAKNISAGRSQSRRLEVYDAARELGCSVRIVYKYFAIFRGPRPALAPASTQKAKTETGAGAAR